MKTWTSAPVSTGRLAMVAALTLLPLAVAAQSQQPTTAKTTSQQPTQIALKDFEENATKYLNQKVTLSGEIQNVLGPRLFTIDEKQWIDLDGETLVLVPSPLAALVRENAEIRLTGTVRPFVRAEIEREWGWFDVTPELEVEFKDRPVIVAETVTGVTDNRVLTMSIDRETAPVGTSGTTATAKPITDAAMLAQATDGSIVGRRVDLKNARVAATAPTGFWINAGNERLFVLPADKAPVTQGQQVNVAGVVLELPAGMKDKLGTKTPAHDEAIYVYANQVTRTS